MGLRVEDERFRGYGLGLMVKGLGFRVRVQPQSSGIRVEGSGFRV